MHWPSFRPSNAEMLLSEFASAALISARHATCPSGRTSTTTPRSDAPIPIPATAPPTPPPPAPPPPPAAAATCVCSGGSRVVRITPHPFGRSGATGAAVEANACAAAGPGSSGSAATGPGPAAPDSATAASRCARGGPQPTPLLLPLPLVWCFAWNSARPPSQRAACPLQSAMGQDGAAAANGLGVLVWPSGAQMVVWPSGAQMAGPPVLYLSASRKSVNPSPSIASRLEIIAPALLLAPSTRMRACGKRAPGAVDGT